MQASIKFADFINPIIRIIDEVSYSTNMHTALR